MFSGFPEIKQTVDSRGALMDYHSFLGMWRIPRNRCEINARYFMPEIIAKIAFVAYGKRFATP